MLVFPHDKVYDEGIAVGKLEVKREFAFGLFGDGMSCEKIAKYINESVDMVKQLEKEWKRQHDKRTVSV
ncbi:MAG: hypothetical protein HFG55_06190 [Lachnospiraceae bacterium]|nr:hypothetical protein [Lachnospiraceae bacterium]